MNRGNSNLRFPMAVLMIVAPPVYSGARIDLRATPPVPPGGYASNTIVSVDTYLVDTGNPQGDLLFRGVFLDFSDSSSTVAFLDPDGPGPLQDNQFDWDIEEGLFGKLCPSCLPLVSWVYPLPTPFPFFMIVLPNDGEVLLGHVIVDVGQNGGMLDVVNHDNPDPNFGARVDFGFGGAGDPVTTWRAFNGDITGGVLELPVVPEPASLVLLTCAAGLVGLMRKKSLAQSRQGAMGYGY